MRLFLIRHGESVDNVAGVYAGSRDSALTAHGVLQARRLGAHLAGGQHASLCITHIFSSDLQRATATAEAILDAQKTMNRTDGETSTAASAIVKVADLRERDFRSAEGRRFGGGGGSSRDRSGASGSSTVSSASAFADAETREEMRVRSERFIDEHLQPLLRRADSSHRHAIAIVSHGLLLNVLLSSLLQRFAPSELTKLLPAAQSAGGSHRRLPEMSLSLRNTAYVDLSADVSNGDEARVKLAVAGVNCDQHLQGLKKTRGGIGSAKFDAKQKTMDSFFGPAAKRQKQESSGPRATQYD